MIMKVLQRIALVLAIIGAINWGLIGFFNFDLVATLFGGQDSVISRIIYGLVGLSGLFCLTLLFEPWDEFELRFNEGAFDPSDSAELFDHRNSDSCFCKLDTAVFEAG